MHIGIYGVSGSGKSSLTKMLIQAHPDYISLSASKIIKESGSEISLDYLSSSTVSANQNVLAVAMKHIAERVDNVFFELHAVIETRDSVESIDPRLLAGLPLDKIYYLDTSPVEVLYRRNSDTQKRRKHVSLEEIELLQRMTVDLLYEAYGANAVEFVRSENAVEAIGRFLCG